MTLVCLRPDDPRWQETLRDCPADIFYTPEYASFSVEGSEDSPLMFLYRDELGVVYDVVLVSPVAQFDFYRHLPLDFEMSPVDIRSPSFNGPVLCANPADREELFLRYRRAVDSYCRNTGVITEFVRVHPLHPLDPGWLQGLEVRPGSRCFYVDLREGFVVAQKGFSVRHRRAAKRAEVNSAEMRFVPANEENVARFCSLYSDTMARNEAKSVDRYSTPYFISLFAALGECARLVESRVQGQLVSSTILYQYNRLLWYAYSATAYELRGTHAHTYAMDRVIEWACGQGLDYFMLGGSFQAGDALEVYKRGYTEQAASVQQLRKVHDAGGLSRLLQAKAGYNRKLGRPVRLDYFPSYRLD